MFQCVGRSKMIMRHLTFMTHKYIFLLSTFDSISSLYNVCVCELIHSFNVMLGCVVAPARPTSIGRFRKGCWKSFFYFATKSSPFLMFLWSSGMAFESNSCSNAFNLPKPRFFSIPFLPKTSGVAKYFASVTSERT